MKTTQRNVISILHLSRISILFGPVQVHPMNQRILIIKLGIKPLKIRLRRVEKQRIFIQRKWNLRHDSRAQKHAKNTSFVIFRVFINENFYFIFLYVWVYPRVIKWNIEYFFYNELTYSYPNTPYNFEI